MKNPASVIRTFLVLIVFGLFFVKSSAQQAHYITSDQIDKVVEKALKAFNVPGMAVAVVKDGRVIHCKGYGVRSLNTMQKTDENTLFAIASNSKAFTSAALGILVDEGKIKWDDRVVDYIPEFQLYSPYVTDEFTIRDLLTHRSGLGLGAGDFMLWPDSSDFTLNDLIHNLRYLKPVSSFRTKYDYDNLLYVVAGQVVAIASGMSWEEFIEEKIMRPLGMDKSAACYDRLKDRSNVADAHISVDGKLRVVPMKFTNVGNPCGGIYTSAAELGKWAIMQLNNGKYGENLSKQIFSEKVHSDMWEQQTIIPVTSPGPYNTHFHSYGLGWGLTDVHGYKMAAHTGGLTGFVTQVQLVPDINLGVIVLTNQQVSAAFTAVANTILDSYFGIKGVDRIKENCDRVLANAQQASDITGPVWEKISQMQNIASKENRTADYWTAYTGRYTDKWFGEVTISIENGKIRFKSLRSPKMTGEMLYYTGNTFVVKWDDRGLDADAFACFSLDIDGTPVSFRMSAISPATDFSFDFQDLDFHRK